MKSVPLSKIAAVTGGRLIYGDGMFPRDVSGMVRDSREVTEGSIFLCIPGENVDGHDFAPAAFKAGAACCIAQHPLENAAGPYILVPDVLRAAQSLAAWYRSELAIPIVGIVGSVGKTTAKEMTAAVLGARFNVLKTPANLNNELGVPLTITNIDEHHDAAVVEMGISNFGEMDRLGAIVRPDICVFTVVGHAHLEFLGDLDGVLRAKSEVFRHMPHDGVAILNGDDTHLAVCDPGRTRILCGIGKNCDIRAENIRAEGTEVLKFDIIAGDVSFPVTVHAFGMHIVTAALLAAAVGMHCGLTPDDISRGLASYRTIDGRAKVERSGGMTIINDCYNANPDSTAAALRSLAALPGRKAAVLGDMKELGPDEALLHREIGILTVSLGIEHAVFCGPLAKYMADARREAAPEAKTEYYETLPELIVSALPLNDIDSVLVKASHSMQFERIIAALEG